MTLGVLGYSPPRRDAMFPRHTAKVTVAVAVINPRCAAIASDSLHVDVASGRCSSVTKIVAAGGRVGALAGISDVDGFNFIDALGAAMERARRLDDVADEFLVAAADHLPRAYERLNTITGLTPAAFPTELLVVGTRDGVVELDNFWSSYDGAALSMTGNLHLAANDRTICEAIGTHLPIVGATEQARVQPQLRHNARDLPPTRNAAATESLAERLVSDVIQYEPRLPRPLQWPVQAPVVAGPVQVESITVPGR